MKINVHIYLLILLTIVLVHPVTYSQDFPIDLSKLGPGDSIVISYQAVVARDMPVDVDSIHCQATVTAGEGLISVVSDDPRTGEALDPTSVEIAIPTMGQWGIMVLGLLLINIAVVGMNEEKRNKVLLTVSE